MPQSIHSTTVNAVQKTGNLEKEFPISIGPRFLELFSENLYSSPNKAFEELIANSWDANATSVYVSIPSDLSSPETTIWVLDNGTSMDAAGLETLWTITSGHKRMLKNTRRPQIGKFGIGKLATYILASEITFICRSNDGDIRTVSFDYRDIEETNPVWDPAQSPLTIRKITESQLKEIVSTIPNGTELLDVLSAGVPHTHSPLLIEEFHHPDPPPIQSSGTWTLVLLTSLRETGISLQTGRIRRMLRTALPLSSDFSIIFNGEPLESTKVEAETLSTWVLGQNLDIEEIDLVDVDVESGQQTASVHNLDINGAPCVSIEGIDGTISGQFSLYKSRITGGKSEQLGVSNGFFVNILGRVVNLEKSDFGLDNLHHGTWAQFRATIRADGLDGYLGVEREALRESRPVRTFRQFLMAIFNKARTELRASRSADWPKAGDILDGSWKVIPMKPLAEVMQERLELGSGIPESIEMPENADFKKTLDEWQATIEQNPGDLISKVGSKPFEGQMPFMRYELGTRELFVNESHPYFAGRSETIEERALLQDFALTDFLTELYLIQNNVDSVTLDDGRVFRDEILMSLAQLRRKTGPEISQMLQEATSNSRGLEVIIGDALSFMDFNVRPMGGKGVPEGVAQAPLSPRAGSSQTAYKFTYDAKSTNRSSGAVKSGNVNPGTLARHRDDWDADYALVIAPDFERGVLTDECQANGITPMRAQDLGKLLMLKAAKGSIDFIKFRTLFELYEPDKVHCWVEDFISATSAEKHLSIASLLHAFDEIGIGGPDTLQTAVVADRIRTQTQNPDFPTEAHVRDAVRGLGVFLPSIVKINNRQIYLSARPVAIRSALIDQLNRLPASMRMGVDLEL